MRRCIVVTPLIYSLGPSNRAIAQHRAVSPYATLHTEGFFANDAPELEPPTGQSGVQTEIVSKLPALTAPRLQSGSSVGAAFESLTRPAEFASAA
jgi:hypothetical protein